MLNLMQEATINYPRMENRFSTFQKRINNMKIDTYITDKIEKEIKSSHTKAVSYENTHNILTITGIALSACAAGVLAIGASVGINLGILIASVSCSLVSCTTLLVDRIYDFEKKSMIAENKSKSLEKEKTCFQLKAGIYKNENESIFVERCEDLLK